MSDRSIHRDRRGRFRSSHNVGCNMLFSLTLENKCHAHGYKYHHQKTTNNKDLRTVISIWFVEIVPDRQSSPHIVGGVFVNIDSILSCFVSPQKESDMPIAHKETVFACIHSVDRKAVLLGF